MKAPKAFKMDPMSIDLDTPYFLMKKFTGKLMNIITNGYKTTL